jgi:hypothetical protein
MTPREFLEAVVRLDVAEFRDKYGSIRRAYHAVRRKSTFISNEESQR